IGVGLGADSALKIEGEDGPGVYGATDLIERIKSDPTLSLKGVRHAVVVGGGNTAIDVARELKQLGVPYVAMVYRRDERDMSGYVHEMVGARQDGVRLLERRQPVALERTPDGRL